MTHAEIIRYRLSNLQISRHDFASPADVVYWLGALQAQDFSGAKWAIGLRCNCTETDVNKAIDGRKIVRTWPMRGTLHFVAASDIKWMLQLLSPRIIAKNASRFRQLELDEDTLHRAEKVFIKALQGGKQHTRNEMLALLNEAGIATAGQRGIHILWYHAQKGLICFSKHNDKQPTFALLNEWIPDVPALTRDEAMATLALRYFSSHGPATLHDFVWWAGLKITEGREALNMLSGQLIKVTVKDKEYWISSHIAAPKAATGVHLLPGFDEYILGYTDRNLILADEHSNKIVPGNNGMFLPTIIINGRVAGTWKRSIKKKEQLINVYPFAPVSDTKQKGITTAARHYGNYSGLKTSINQ